MVEKGRSPLSVGRAQFWDLVEQDTDPWILGGVVSVMFKDTISRRKVIKQNIKLRIQRQLETAELVNVNHYYRRIYKLESGSGR